VSLHFVPTIKANTPFSLQLYNRYHIAKVYSQEQEQSLRRLAAETAPSLARTANPKPAAAVIIVVRFQKTVQLSMPGAAETVLQEPEHELTVVQQVQRGSISSTGTKALLTVKLPGK
jgi:hypothetical protein